MLSAEHDVKLLAATNTANLTSNNQGGSASIDVSFGSQTGVTVSASGSQGKTTGTDITYSNTHLTAGQQISLTSGNDTTLKGAVASAPQIVASVGHDLTVESLQDSSTYQSKQNSLGGSVTIGPAPSGSLSVSASKINSDYLSVTEQTGLKAGDQGFQVNVQGNTTLTGGAITSTQTAVDQSKNTFHTDGTLALTDLQNKAKYKGESVGATLGTGVSLDGKLAPMGSSAGIGSDSNSASSTTQAAISGIAGNKAARTGDKEAGLTNTFDASKVQSEIDAQVQITQTFGREASKAIGDYADTQLKQAATLRDQAAKEPDPTRASELTAQAQTLEAQWGNDGTLRVAAHTLVGGLTGGVNGAAGAAVGTLTAPEVAKVLADANMESTLAKTLTALASTTAGTLVGGTAGATAAFNEVTNNYLKHDEIVRLLAAKKECAATGAQAACGTVKELEALDKRRDQDLNTACADSSSAACSKAQTEVRKAYADILRASVDGRDAKLDPMTRAELLVGVDQSHTQQMADGTLSQLSRTVGLASGAGAAAYEGLAGTLSGLGTLIQAGFGNEAARDKVGATTAGIMELLSQPQAWNVILDHASKDQTLKMADAYERGDAKALGEMSGQIIGSLIDPIAAFKGVKLGVKGAELLADLSKVKAATKAAETEAIASALENDNFYRDGVAKLFPQELKTSSGITILANPDKTTTVLGAFGRDTDRIINTELGLPKSMVIEGSTQPGSFNLLNTPDSLYTALGV